MAERTSSIPRGRNCWFASSMARGWAMPPMKPWPMMRTLTFFTFRLPDLSPLAAPAALLRRGADAVRRHFLGAARLSQPHHPAGVRMAGVEHGPEVLLPHGVDEGHDVARPVEHEPGLELPGDQHAHVGAHPAHLPPGLH